ncbi:unnamed protein product, partial [Prunus brigantina]
LIARIAGIPGLGEVRAGREGEALPVRRARGPGRTEGPAPVRMRREPAEPRHIPRDQPLALLARATKQHRLIDPKDRSQSIPSTRKRRRGGRGNNLFANNDRNSGDKRRNNPVRRNEEGHGEEDDQGNDGARS